MSQRDSGQARGINLPVLIAGLVIGLVVGVLVAWEAFPVRWKDTDPADLRATYQDDYIRMTADALAVTGDSATAQERLAALAYKGEDLGRVAAAVERLATEDEATGDDAGAVRLRLLAQAADLPAPTEETVTTGKVPTLVFAPNWPALGGLAIFTATAVLVLWLVLRRRRAGGDTSDSLLDEYAAGTAGAAPTTPRAEPESRFYGEQGDGRRATQETAPGSRFGAPPPTSTSRPAAGTAATVPLTPSPHYPPTPMGMPAGDEADHLLDDEAGEDTLPEEAYADIENDVVDEDDIGDWEEEADSEELPAMDSRYALMRGDDASGDEAEPEVTDEESDFDLSEIEFAPGRGSAAAASQPAVENEAPPDALGVFEAEYRYGDDDYDCSFSIEVDGSFLGECGVGVSEVLDFDGAQRVAALEVWLFDKGDIRTVSKLLVSEFVEHDDALRSQLSAKGDLVVGRRGEVLILETLGLMVTATVRQCDYLPDAQRPNSVFGHVNIELVAERGDDVG